MNRPLEADRRHGWRRWHPSRRSDLSGWRRKKQLSERCGGQSREWRLGSNRPRGLCPIHRLLRIQLHSSVDHQLPAATKASSMEGHRLPLHVGRLPGQSLRSPIATYWMHHRTRRYYYLIICNKIQSRIFQTEEKKRIREISRISLSDEVCRDSSSHVFRLLWRCAPVKGVGAGPDSQSALAATLLFICVYWTVPAVSLPRYSQHSVHMHVLQASSSCSRKREREWKKKWRKGKKKP